MKNYEKYWNCSGVLVVKLPLNSRIFHSMNNRDLAHKGWSFCMEYRKKNGKRIVRHCRYSNHHTRCMGGARVLNHYPIPRWLHHATRERKGNEWCKIIIEMQFPLSVEAKHLQLEVGQATVRYLNLELRYTDMATLWHSWFNLITGLSSSMAAMHATWYLFI